MVMVSCRQLLFQQQLSVAMHSNIVESMTANVRSKPHSRVGLQIAVLRETEAAGPYCSLVMAVVVVKDVLVFVAFAANLEVVSAVRSAET